MPAVVLNLELGSPHFSVVKVTASFEHGTVEVLSVEGVVGWCPSVKTLVRWWLPQIEEAVLLEEWHQRRPEVLEAQRAVFEPAPYQMETYHSRTMDEWLSRFASDDPVIADESERVLCQAGSLMAEDLVHAIVTGPVEGIPAALQAIRLIEETVPKRLIRALSHLLGCIEAEITRTAPHQIPVGGYQTLSAVIDTVETLGSSARRLGPILEHVAAWCDNHELAHRTWRLCQKLRFRPRNPDPFTRPSNDE